MFCNLHSSHENHRFQFMRNIPLTKEPEEEEEEEVEEEKDGNVELEDDKEEEEEDEEKEEEKEEEEEEEEEEEDDDDDDDNDDDHEVDVMDHTTILNNSSFTGIDLIIPKRLIGRYVIYKSFGIYKVLTSQGNDIFNLQRFGDSAYDAFLRNVTLDPSLHTKTWWLLMR